MPLSTAGKNTALDSLLIAFASLHSAQPNDSGSNEISGGTPAYARKAVTFGGAQSGSRTATGQVIFDVPAGTTVSHVGYWTAANVFLGYDQLDQNETYGGQGTYTLTSQGLSVT